MQGVTHDEGILDHVNGLLWVQLISRHRGHHGHPLADLEDVVKLGVALALVLLNVLLDAQVDDLVLAGSQDPSHLDTQERLPEESWHSFVTDNIVDHTSDQCHEGGGAHGHKSKAVDNHVCDITTANLAVKGVVPLDVLRHHPLPKACDVSLIPGPVG